MRAFDRRLMQLAEFDFELPSDRIALRPASPRDSARLLVVQADAGLEDRQVLDLPSMLRWGSLFFACYFVISFPMIYRLDEEAGEDWPVSRVAIDALAAGMLLLFLLDMATRVAGRMY